MNSPSYSFQVLAFYRFCDLSDSDLTQIKEKLHAIAQQYNSLGLVILADEGINGTVAGSREGMQALQETLRSFAALKELEFKISYAAFQPFKRFKINIRPEIVTARNRGASPRGKNRHMSASEWHQRLTSGEAPILIDTRNDYESRIGTFPGAITPPIKKFYEFKKFLEDSGLPKDQPLLMFCTGGIRCEKALLEAEELGYHNTYQLDGGILKYLEEFPEGKFEGECFVFDNRVAVDAQLLPSQKYKLCPLCGEPGSTKMTCGHCGESGVLCGPCLHKQACSKNCAYHLGVLRT